MDLAIEDRVAVVTAGGAGIGLAAVKALVREGAHVVTADLDTSAVEPIDGVTAVRLDLLEPSAAGRLVNVALREYGRVDIVVNALGRLIAFPDGILEMTDEDWTRSYEINLMTTVRTTRAALPDMVSRGSGSIVSVASVAGRQPTPTCPDYCASKAAVLNLSKSLALHFGPNGIRPNVVTPGLTITPQFLIGMELLAQRLDVSRESAIEHFVHERKLAVGHAGQAEDVAAAIVFLAPDAARQITGTELCVDGGDIKYV